SPARHGARACLPGSRASCSSLSRCPTCKCRSRRGSSRSAHLHSRRRWARGKLGIGVDNGGVMKARISCALCFVAIAVLAYHDSGPVVVYAQDAPHSVAASPAAAVGTVATRPTALDWFLAD